MLRYPLIHKIAALALVASLTGCAATPAATPVPGAAEVNYEGLATIRSRAFSVAQVRPGTDFGAYSRVKLGTPQLAYRTPDRAAGQFPLNEEQKKRFLSNLVSAFDEEFAGFRALELVDEAGPDTLALDIRVEDIVVTVASSAVGRTGRAAALLEASADAVMTVELRDSQSNEILARGVDTGAASGGALRTPEGELRTRFESSGKVVETWAAKARAGLENLLREGR
jgi:hypothetical protein